MSSIVIDSPTAEGDTVECVVRPSADLARFFTGKPFTTSYDCSIEDVPESVLVIPVLANVCPVAWANGADVYVETVDATFARALEDVKASLLEMYDFLEGGTLYAKETTTSEPLERAADASDSALLFTGGVDSTSSYVRHREESPTLVSIRGWTISPGEAGETDWQHLQNRVTGFADERDLETAFIETNTLEALDHAMLLAHYKRFVDGAWYSSVGHGLGLLGLCAPMATRAGSRICTSLRPTGTASTSSGVRARISTTTSAGAARAVITTPTNSPDRSASTPSPTTSRRTPPTSNSRPATCGWTATAASAKSAIAPPSASDSPASSRATTLRLRRHGVRRDPNRTRGGPVDSRPGRTLHVGRHSRPRS